MHNLLADGNGGETEEGQSINLWPATISPHVPTPTVQANIVMAAAATATHSLDQDNQDMSGCPWSVASINKFLGFCTLVPPGISSHFRISTLTLKTFLNFCFSSSRINLVPWTWSDTIMIQSMHMHSLGPCTTQLQRDYIFIPNWICNLQITSCSYCI